MQSFKAKELSIIKATEKVDALLLKCAEISKHNSKDKRIEYWNHLHDIKDRLKDRYYANYSNYKEWHWNKYGYNVYSL